MSLRKCTPCDYDGHCPYDAEYSRDCEYWCGADEPQDIPEEWEEEEESAEWNDCDNDMGFDPYMGCITDDC